VAVGSAGIQLREGGARLVPITVRVMHDGLTLADTFLWSLDEQHVTPEVRSSCPLLYTEYPCGTPDEVRSVGRTHGAHAVGRSANSLRSARRHSAMDGRAAVRSGAQWSRLRRCLSNGAWHLHVPLRRPLLPSCAWIWTCLRKWSILSQLRSGDTWTG
jgi:hypothetical protein